MKSGKSFWSLNFIATVYDILAIVILIGMVLAVIIILVIVLFLSEKIGLSFGASIPLILVVIFGGLVSAVASKSISESIRLLLAIEIHTAQTNTIMEQTLALLQKVADNTEASAVILHHMDKKK